MNKIICNSVEFVFRTEIEKMKQGTIPVLKDSGIWKKIDVIEKPVYQSIIKQNDAGPTNEETVTVKAKHNNLTELLIKYCGFYTVLRMSTNKGILHVGNIKYPCSMEFTSDKEFDNYSFKAVSPA